MKKDFENISTGIVSPSVRVWHALRYISGKFGEKRLGMELLQKERNERRENYEYQLSKYNKPGISRS